MNRNGNEQACLAAVLFCAGKQGFESIEDGLLTCLAQDETDIEQAQRLRHEVFFQETLGKTLPGRIDQDHFDTQCDHLLVRSLATGHLLGSYRLNRGGVLGFYSQTKFRMDSFLAQPTAKLEIGRLCVARDSRSGTVFTQLLRGVMAYASLHNIRQVFGCSSVVTSYGLARFAPCQEWLRVHKSVQPDIDPEPVCPALIPEPASTGDADTAWRDFRKNSHSPMSFYISLGAKVGSRPCHDKLLGTIEYFTLLDLHNLAPVGRRLLQASLLQWSPTVTRINMEQP